MSRANEKPRGKILLVGRRKHAEATARRHGWKPVTIDVPPRCEQASNAFGGSADWAIKNSLERFPKSPPVAVAAVATGAVVAAAAVREHFGLPGISREAALRCHDKLVMKKAISAAGIPCAPWMEIGPDTSTDQLIGTLGLPLLLKIPISSGGRGVWMCNSPAEVTQHRRPGLLAEGFITGTEMSIETFRAEGKTLFLNPTFYLKQSWANIVPAGLGASEMKLVSELGERVHRTLDIPCGITHMELFLTEAGPVFGEIAARPPGGYIMELIRRAYGFNPWEAVLRIAAGEIPSFPSSPNKFAGAWLIHPGPGRVAAIRGLDEAHSLPGIVGLTCRLSPGDHVSTRTGTGDSKGRIISEAPTLEACAHALHEALDRIHISLDKENHGE